MLFHKDQLNRKAGRFLLLTLLLFLLTGCQASADKSSGPLMEEDVSEGEALVFGIAPGADHEAGNEERTDDSGSIRILFTANTAGQIDKDVGMSGVSSLKKELLSEGPYVALVDCGNHYPESLKQSADGKKEEMRPTAGEISYADMVCLMNSAGYDQACLGVNELSTEKSQLRQLMLEARYRYLCCNISYTGEDVDPLFGLASSDLIDFGGTQVAFIGVTGLQTKQEQIEASSKDDFRTDRDAVLYQKVQAEVNECRRKGAHFVVLLSNFERSVAGEGQKAAEALIRNTEGIDAVLDGSEQEALKEKKVTNLKGEEVILSRAGSGLSEIGLLSITAEGELSVRLIYTYRKKDPAVNELILKINAEKKGN